MTAWKDTAAQLFAEADAAKEKAKADFLAALRPPNPAVLPAGQQIPLVDAITVAQWKALLTHIGPVSSDGSVAIGISIDPVTKVPQLDLKAAAGWPEITVDPSVGAGHAAPVKTVVWQMTGGTPNLPIAIWIKTSTADIAWEKLWPQDNLGGGGMFIKAFAVDFTDGSEPTQELSSNPDYPPPSTLLAPPFTIGGKSGWMVANPLARNWPWIDYANMPKISGGTHDSPGIGLFWYDRTSSPPLIWVPLANLGVPDLKTLSELWIFAETGGTHGDTASYENYWYGIGDVIPSSGNPLTSAFSYIAKQKSYGTGAWTIAGTAGQFRGTSPTVLNMLASGSTSDVTLAMRILPDHAEVYSGPAVALVNGSFTSIRGALTLRGHLKPDHAMRNVSEGAAWAGATAVNLILHSECNRDGFTYANGPVWKRLRIDYALAGSNSSAGGGAMGSGLTDVVVASGVISGFGPARNLKVSGAGPLVGIDTTDITIGDDLELTFASGLTITGAGTPSSGSKILTQKFGLGSWQDIDVSAYDVLRLKLVPDGSGGTYWKMVGGIS